MSSRRSFLVGIGSLLAAAPLAALSTTARASQIADILREELASGRPCQSEAAAIRATLGRLAKTKPPATGRSIVVDMPSQHLGCYEDGNLVLESRVVVGDRGWKTPDLDTRVSFVRWNPSWTVPESILKVRNWRGKLGSNPAYFSHLNFLVELDGKMVEPEDASDRWSQVGRFVQQPGPGNALGRVKVGLAAGGDVYLHDTNDPEAFQEEQRSLSHGCIRVERAIDVACWVLGVGGDVADEAIARDDRANHTDIPSPVRVVTTYFTAWPDSDGRVLYYPDIYSRDGGGDGSCGVERSAAWGSIGGYDDVEPTAGNDVPQDVIYAE